MSEDRLKQLYERAQAQRETLSGCAIPPETMIDVLEGRVAGAERERTMLAILSDPNCRREFELLRAMVEQAPAEAKVQAHRPRSLWPLRLAASIAVLVAGGLVWRSLQDPAPDVLRDANSAAVQLIAPEEAARVVEGVRFTWHVAPRALIYEFSLIDADAQLVFSTTQSDTTLVLPVSVSLPQEAELRWWVEAVTAEGERLRSPLRSLRLAAP